MITKTSTRVEIGHGPLKLVPSDLREKAIMFNNEIINPRFENFPNIFKTDPKKDRQTK